MRERWNVLIGAACVGISIGCAGGGATRATPPSPSVESATTEDGQTLTRQNLVTLTADVVSVDQARRLVTLRGPRGDTETVAVGDEVRNLAQVEAGDQVVVRYYESLAVDLEHAGSPEAGVRTTEASRRAALGEKPAAGTERTTTLTATIQAIDPARRTVTLKGPQGNEVTVNVGAPERLEGLEKGDLVAVTYTQAVAISVSEVGE